MADRARYVAGFVLDDDGGVLLLRKTRPGWQAGRLNGMGGKVEPGESYADAMLREGREESGISWEWEHFATLECNDERHAGEIAFFVARAFESEVHELHRRANDVGERFEHVAIDDVALGRENTIPNIRWLVPMAAATNDRHDWPYLVAEKGALFDFARDQARTEASRG